MANNKAKNEKKQKDKDGTFHISSKKQVYTQAEWDALTTEQKLTALAVAAKLIK